MEVHQRRKRLRRIENDDDDDEDDDERHHAHAYAHESDSNNTHAAGPEDEAVASEVGDEEELSDFDVKKRVEKKPRPAATKRKGLIRKMIRKKKVRGGEIVDEKDQHTPKKRKKTSNADDPPEERVSLLKQQSAADKALQARQEAIKRGELARKRLAEQLARKNATPKEDNPAETVTKTRKMSGALKRKLEKQENDFANRKSNAIAAASDEFECDECVVFVQGWQDPWDVEGLSSSLKRFSDRFKIRLVGTNGLAAVVRFDSELTALDAVETQHHVGTKLKIRKARPGDDPARWFARSNSPTHHHSTDNWMGAAASVAPTTSPVKPGSNSPSSPHANQPVFPVSPTKPDHPPTFFPVSPSRNPAPATVFPVSPSRPPGLAIESPDVGGNTGHPRSENMETPRKTARISFLMNPDPEPNDDQRNRKDDSKDMAPVGADRLTNKSTGEAAAAKAPDGQHLRGVRRVQVYDDDI